MYAFSRLSWYITHGHGVFTQSVPTSTLALGLHAHTQWYCLLLLGQRSGGCMYSNVLLLFPLNV